MSVQVIKDKCHFQTELAAAGDRLVVVDFCASWCGPCQVVGQYFSQMPIKYPKALFFKVDVDKCQEIAISQGVSSMPTFILYRNYHKIDRMQGTDISMLETKIKQHIYDTPATATACTAASGNIEDHNNADEQYDFGLMNLKKYISKQKCECINEANDHTMAQCFTRDAGYLQSDCDQHLILSVTFNQVVKIHLLKIKASARLGPKDIKLFINQPKTIDFEMAESMNSIQDVCLISKNLEGLQPISLRYDKFQNVHNIQIYVKNNQSGGEVTQIDYLEFIGSPLPAAAMKVNDNKRVPEKKRECHCN